MHPSFHHHSRRGRALYAAPADYAYFETVPVQELWSEAELGEQRYGRNPTLKEIAIRAHQYAERNQRAEPGPRFALPDEPLTLPAPNLPLSVLPGVADMITLTSFALGIWWCVGGPWYAAILSIIGDELDGRYARATGTTSERGALLDWGQDVTLTPLALMRLGINVGMGPIAIVAAPALLYTQSHLKASGYRPEYGSARAVIMLAGVVAGA